MELTVVINQSYKFLFVHVPKSAGTSVTNALSKLNRYCDLEIGGTAFGESIQSAYSKRYGLAKHTSISRLAEVIGTGDLQTFFKFAFVRNPFVRALSTYRFLLRWGGVDPAFLSKMQSFGSFSEYVRSNTWASTGGPDNIFRPQLFWLRKGREGNEIGVDYVGHVERLQEDMIHIFRHIGVSKHVIENLDIQRLNASNEVMSLEAFQDSAVVDAIRKHYARDFETFGYSLDPNDAQF